MTLQNHYDCFVDLGIAMKQLSQKQDSTHFTFTDFDAVMQRAYNENNWFTKENILLAIGNLAEMLQAENLQKWIARYPTLKNEHPQKTVGLIFAGNIPLVGFHDLLTGLIAGHRIVAKLSSKDRILTQWLRQMLIAYNPEYRDMIVFTEGQISGFDAVIATGSDSSAQYFERYFAKVPHIIRRNRNAVAILSGNETKNELDGLADDIFSFFGLGCRNVSKLYIPENYDITNLKPHFSRYEHILHHHKYTNNFEYRRVIFLMNKVAHTDFGFVLLKEDNGLVSPPGIIYYEYYSNRKTLDFNLDLIKDRLQVIVSKEHYNFGTTQKPALWDYADTVDSLDFLLNL